MNLPSLSNLTFLKKLSYGKRIHPVRDWFIVITVTSILFLLSAAWNVWLFLHADGTSIEPTVDAPVDAGLSPKTLESVHMVFDKRAAEEAAYKTTYHFPDPSVPF